MWTKTWPPKRVPEIATKTGVTLQALPSIVFELEMLASLRGFHVSKCFGKSTPCGIYSQQRRAGLHCFLCNLELIALWSRHVKPSSAKGEKRLKRKKIPKFVQAKALPESEIMYKSKDRCTGMKDRITRDREIQRYAKIYQKPSPQTSVHLEQQVELRKKVESGSTIADSEAA